MLYQIIHKHTPAECPSNHEGRFESINNEFQEAHNSGSLKILYFVINGPEHRVFMLVESRNFEDVHVMLDGASLWGDWEIVPVIDPNAERSIRYKDKVAKDINLNLKKYSEIFVINEQAFLIYFLDLN